MFSCRTRFAETDIKLRTVRRNKMDLRDAPLLAAGFRPFFLGAAAWAAIALGVWIAALLGVVALPDRFDPISWHIHEMVFGVVLAGVAGFLLTAIANWTGRPPVRGGRLAALVALWLIGRAACLVSAVLPAWLGVMLDLAFPLGLAGVVAYELAAAGDRRNAPLLAPLLVLAIADLLMHLSALGVALPIGLGWRLALACVLVLISVIGGRIVPNFTRSWLAVRGERDLPPASGLLNRVALGVLHAGLFAWALLPDVAPIGLLLLAGAFLHLWRLARWRGPATWREPLLFILHAGYLWLPFGVAMLGLSMMLPGVPAASALHAITVGAIGIMLLAMMTRVTLGHTGRAQHADASTVAIYGLVTLAALLRVAAGWPGSSMTLLLEAASAAWIAAFALFLAHYGPMLVRRRLH